MSEAARRAHEWTEVAMRRRAEGRPMPMAEHEARAAWLLVVVHLLGAP